MRRNPYLFAVGCPRSGTTLLQRMLDHHPQLAVANDTHFIPKAPGVGAGTDPVFSPALGQWVQAYRRFHRLGLPEAAVRAAAAGSRRYSEFVSALYSEFGRMHGKPLAGEKTPDYCRYLPVLHALFPWARVVHIIRDGRDVALSALEWAREDKGPGRYSLWREEPIAVCALWWSWQVSSGRRDGAALGPARYREVRYEHLSARPEEALRDVTAFLELPYASEMVSFHEGKRISDPGLSAKKAWLPATPGLRNWRSEMAERDVALFEALAGDLLSDLGYERAATARSPEVTAAAERCRRWWESELARRAAEAGDSSSQATQAPV
jgi:sulfotransferase family protein